MIKLLALDVDGTLSEGEIRFDSLGNESKGFSVKDGLALHSWRRMGREIVIITGRKSEIVERRAKELGIEWIFQGVRDKGACLAELKEKLGIAREEVAAIGDDLNDLKMFAQSGLTFAPCDATRIVRERVDVVLEGAGGKGAVREMVEYILEQEGELAAFIALWE